MNSLVLKLKRRHQYSVADFMMLSTLGVLGMAALVSQVVT